MTAAAQEEGCQQKPSIELDDENMDSQNTQDKENIRMKRIQAFQEFMTSIPRHWSPSMLPGLDEAGNLQAFPTKESFDFNWSIDQVALLNPADFSCEKNESFFEDALSQSVNQRFAQECQDFFNQSRILPSPESENTSGISFHPSSSSFHLLPRQCMTSANSAAAGLQPYFTVKNSPQTSLNLSSIPTAAYSVYSPFSRMRTTPYKEDKDMSVTESKLPTPVNGSKARRKKSKLFVDEVSGQQHLLTLEEDSNSCSTTADDDTTEFDLRSDSMTAFSSNMVMAGLALSPIQVYDENVRLGGDVTDFNETDEAFSRDVISMETSTQFDSQVTTSMGDSGCVSKSSFFYKTSTPSQPERHRK